MMKQLNVITILSVLMFTVPSWAGPQRTTYQARIVKPNGYSLESSSVNFRFTVLDPSASCVMYVEDYAAVNMTSSGGLISFSLGTGVVSFPASSTTTTFSTMFDNSQTSFSCQSPGIYNPIPTDIRKIVMQFNDGNGWQTLPAMAINAVPYAMYATKSQDSEKLNGKADTAFLQKASDIPTCATGKMLYFNMASFSCIDVPAAGVSINSVSVSGSALSITGTVSDPVITMQAASMSQDGYLTSLDYAEFKAKLSASSTQIINTLGYTPVSSGAVASQIASSTLTGDVSGNPGSNTVGSVGGKSSGQISASIDDTLAATSSATVDTIVKRNSSGNSTFNDIYANAAKINFVDIYKPSTSFNIRLQAPTSLSANYNLTLPSTTGVSGQVISTDGAGNLSWINAATGSVASVNANAPLSSTGGSTPTISITQATSSADGYLSSVDWQMFNNKADGATTTTSFATLSNNINAVSSSVASLESSTAASFAAMTSSQWTTSGSAIYYNSGNVGIGTSSPAYPLVVSGSSYISNNLGIGTTPHPNANLYVNGVSYFNNSLKLSDTNGLVFTYGPAAPQIARIYSGGIAINDLRFEAGSVEKMRITSGGNVGIGTPTPTAKLHLAAGTSTTASLKITSGTLLTSPQSGTVEYDGSDFYFTDGTSTRRSLSSIGSSAVTSSSIASALGYTPADDTTVTNLSSTVATSFSTTATSFTNLTNNINSVSSSVTSLQSSTVASLAAITSSQWTTSGTNIFYNSGSVGIGTTSPESTQGRALHVYNNLNDGTVNSNALVIAQSANRGAYFVSLAPSNQPGGIVFRHDAVSNISDGGEILYNHSTKSMQFKTSGTEVARLTASGSVGIGTTSPLESLDIKSGHIFHTGGDLLHYFNAYYDSSVPANKYAGYSGGSKHAGGVGFNPTTGMLYFSNTAVAGSSGMNASINEKMVITKDGSVGIGTSSPLRLLDVAGAGAFGAAGGRIHLGTGMAANEKGLQILYDTTNDGVQIQGHHQSVGYKNVLLNPLGGNVGIGTSSATAKLQVDHASAAPNSGPVLMLGNSANLNSSATAVTIDTGMGQGLTNIVGGAKIKNDGSGYTYLGARGAARILLGDGTLSLFTGNSTSGAANGSVTWSAGGGEALFINSSGNIGIATMSPTERLHVNGNLRVQGSTDCILGNGAGGTNCSSDVRLKENIKSIPDALEKINSLRGIEFDWNQKSLSFGRHDIGVIAQDVEKVFPTAVIADKNTGYKKVDYAVLVAPLIEAIKSLYYRIIGVEERNDNQDRQIASKADQEALNATNAKIQKLESENAALRAWICKQDPVVPICR